MRVASLVAMEPITVNVRLFAILRERAGVDSIELELPAGATVEEAIAALGRTAGLAGVIDRLPVAMAVNRDYAGAETVLSAGDEVIALASAPSERALRDAVVGAGMPGGVPNDTIDGASGVV